MKKSILTIATFITAVLMTSCSSSGEKVEDAKENAIEAAADLNRANEEYMADMENYRKTTNAKIEANNKSIAEFKTRIENEKKEAKADYIKKIDELEKKNSDVKKKMDDYKNDGKANWESFKAEFNRDMEELGNAISSFGENSKK